MSPQDASAINSSAKETTAQEPQDDAREDADNLSAKDAESVITKDVSIVIKVYFVFCKTAVIL